jgi:hypothetical protein
MMIGTSFSLLGEVEKGGLFLLQAVWFLHTQKIPLVESVI